MHAQVGDQLIRDGRLSGMAEVVGTIIEVPHEDGSPPYLVKFYKDGHENLMTPEPRKYWVREHRVMSPMHPVWGARHRWTN